MLRKKEAIERRNSLLCKASVTIQTPWVSGCITQTFIKFLRICSLQNAYVCKQLQNIAS
jgi:hypothetical protein